MMQSVDVTQVIDALRNACRLRGQRISEQDITEMGAQLLGDVRQRYNLTADEICQAVKYGMQGDYGEFSTINYVVVFKWLKIYALSDERQRRRREEIKATSRRLTEDEIAVYRKKARRFVNDAYLNYKATNVLDLTLPEVMIIVTHLQRNGRFPQKVDVLPCDYEAAKRRIKAPAGDMATMLERSMASAARKCAYERIIKQIFDNE